MNGTPITPGLGVRSTPMRSGTGKPSTMTWLLIAAGVQMVMFVSFIGFFFSSEQHRQGELTDMQSELHRLRLENARQSKRLIHANKRMLKYEADIRAELAVGGVGDNADGGGGDDIEDSESEPADKDGNDPDDEEAEAEDEEAMAMAEDSEAEREGGEGGGHGHGSIAPAANIKPVAAARAAGSSTAGLHHGHPQAASRPSAAAAAAAAAAMPPVLRGKCVQLEHEWWTYELCFGRRVKQFHKDHAADAPSSANADSHALGAYVAPPEGASPSLMLQRYRGGEPCHVGEVSRNVEVRLECDTVTAVQLQSVTEPHTCHYFMTVAIPEADCGQVKGGSSSSSSGGESGGGGGGAGAVPDVTSKPRAASTTSTSASITSTSGASASVTAAIGSPSSELTGSSVVPPFDASARERSLGELQALNVHGSAENEAKRTAVIHAIRHAWKGYADHAFGADEVRPISRGKHDWRSGTDHPRLARRAVAGWTQGRVSARGRLGAYEPQPRPAAARLLF